MITRVKYTFIAVDKDGKPLTVIHDEETDMTGCKPVYKGRIHMFVDDMFAKLDAIEGAEFVSLTVTAYDGENKSQTP
jgi:hypothetical protein